MGFFEGLHTAASLDRLTETLKLSRPSPDPIMNLSNQLIEGVLENFCQRAADDRFRARRLAQMREREQPGYTAELNQQRALLGLPPI
jgi:hypothetical protein